MATGDALKNSTVPMPNSAGRGLKDKYRIKYCWQQNTYRYDMGDTSTIPLSLGDKMAAMTVGDPDHSQLSVPCLSNKVKLKLK